MDTVLSILRPLVPGLYFLVFLCYLINLLNPKNPLSRLSTPSLAFAVATHGAFCILLGVRFEHHPMASVPEILGVVALALALVYLFIELWRRNRSTGVFVVPFVLITQIASSIGMAPTIEINPLLRDTLFGMHTGTVALSYAALFLSAVYAVMLILFHRALRRKSFGLLFERLPSLAVIAQMNRGSAMVGFCFLTVAIASGVVWAHSELDGNWLNAKVLFTFVIWLVFGFSLLANYALHWSNRRVAIVTLTGFVLMVLGGSIVNIFLAGWHAFGR